MVQVRRFLVASGTADYPGAQLRGLPSVRRDLDQIVRCFTSAPLGYERVLPEFDLNPDARALAEELARWLQKTGGLTEDDCVVFYYSGHGVIQDGELYLLAADAEDASPLAGEPRILVDRAISAQRLISAFAASPVGQVLLLIDACHSGGLSAPLPRTLQTACRPGAPAVATSAAT